MTILDVARTVAEALTDRDLETLTILPPDRAVQAVAASGDEIHPHQTDRVAVFHAAFRRISPVARRLDRKRRRIRRMQKSGPASADGRPGQAIRIDGADRNERQKRKELAMLIEQEVPQHPSADCVHLIDDAHACLQFELALMPGRSRRLHTF